MMASRYEVVKQGPPIEVFALNMAYMEDTFPNKVNLSVGAYRTDEGKPWVLPVVKKVEKDLANDNSQNHEYLPALGLDSFSSAATSLVLGSNNSAILEGRAFGVQTLSGTGALRVGAECLSRLLHCKTFYYSKPTWGMTAMYPSISPLELMARSKKIQNELWIITKLTAKAVDLKIEACITIPLTLLLCENHHLLFINSGFTDPRQYRYWDPSTRSIDFKGMIEDLREAPPSSVIVLHACAHNPTGCDPTKDQWKVIETVVREKNLIPLFDAAYQGFATGNLEVDAWAIRFFAEKGHEMIVTQSFAKNFGLYNERVGNLTMIVSDKSVIPALRSQLILLIRAMYSNPPNHGARIVSSVLNNPILFSEWEECIKIMSSRIVEMRKRLQQKLLALGTPSKNQWKHIVEQIGMFSFTGLTPQQVDYLIKKYHIYMLKSGRMNMCGLTTKNIDYVANAIHETIKLFPDDSSF